MEPVVFLIQKELITKHFELRPAGIIDMLSLRNPIYKQTAAYGHFGRQEADFPWERIDKAVLIRYRIFLTVNFFNIRQGNVFSDFPDTRRNINFKFFTSRKGIGPDFLHTIWNDNFSQIFAVIETSILYLFQTIR